MKLNHDCVRHMLLTIEEKPSQDPIFLNQLREQPLLKGYSDDEIIYTASKLKEAQYLTVAFSRGDNRILNVAISEITWEGHLFLDNIRDNQVWKSTKEITGKVSSVSLPILADVAKTVILKTIGLS